MKITTLKIKNMFGIKEFTSDGKNIELDGVNGAGKTGVIDAIKYALTNKSEREFVIRKGEDEGEVLLEFDNDLSIHRKARTNKADYKLIKMANVPRTEGFLREIFTPLQLDPVAFSEMDSNEQNRIILDLIDFKWDTNWILEQFGEIPPTVNYEQNILRVLHEIQSEKGHYFLKRENVNRDRRNKAAFIEDIAKTLPENYNAAHWDAINLGEIYTKIETIRNHNDRITEAKNIVDGQAAKRKSLLDEKLLANEQLISQEKEDIHAQQLVIKELEQQLADAKAKVGEIQREVSRKIELLDKDYKAELATLEGEVKQFEALAKEEPKAFADLQAEADNTQAMKAHINEYNRMVALKNEVEDLKVESDNLTASIEKARTLPGEILAQCTLPIVGLTIKDGDPLINGLPISNLSEGEKMDLCIDVTAAKEGALKLILLDGIEKLDNGRREDAYARLKAKGIQFIATRTTDDENLTVIEL